MKRLISLILQLKTEVDVHFLLQSLNEIIDVYFVICRNYV